MKKIILSLAAVAVLSSSASFADDVSLSGLLGSNNERYYDVGVSHNIGSFVLGGQVETEQSNENTLLKNDYSVSLGYKSALPYGFNAVTSVALGESIAPNANDRLFYNAGVSVSHQIYGPISASAAFRYRSTFSSSPVITEKRESASVKWTINSHNSLSVDGHTYAGNPSLSHIIGVSYSYTF
jgi:hypothetical protein